MNPADQVLQWWNGHLAPFVGLIVPFAVLFVGWLVALVVSSSVRRLLLRTHLDNRLVALVMGKEAATDVAAEKWIGKGAFYLVMVFVLMGFFQTLGMTALSGRTGTASRVFHTRLGGSRRLLAGLPGHASGGAGCPRPAGAAGAGA